MVVRVWGAAAEVECFCSVAELQVTRLAVAAFVTVSIASVSRQCQCPVGVSVGIGGCGVGSVRSAPVSCQHRCLSCQHFAPQHSTVAWANA